MRRVVRSIVRSAAVLSVGIGVAAASAPAVAQQPVTADEPRLELVSQDFAVEPDGTFELVYRLTGVADDALDFVPEPPPPPPPPSEDEGLAPPVPVPPVPLRLFVTNYRPISDPDDVRALVGGDVDERAFVGAVDGVVLDDVRERATVEPDGSVTIRIEVLTDVVDSVEERLKLATPGLHPLRVQLRTGEPGADVVVATAGTVVQRLPGSGDEPAAPPIDLAIVTALPEPDPTPSPAEMAAVDAVLDDAIVLAGAIPGPVTIEMAPATVATRAATPEGSAELAAALDGDELVALPIVPFDVSSAAGAERGDLFADFLAEGQDLLTESVPGTPSRRDVWMTTTALSGDGARQLRDVGVRFVVMPAELYRSTVDRRLPRTDLFVEAQLPDGDRMPLLVVDLIAEDLTAEATDEILEDGTAVEWAVGTIAHLLLEQADADDAQDRNQRRSLVLTTPELLPPDPRLLVALQEVATTTPSLRFGPASALIGTTDVQLTSSGAPVTVALPQSAGPSLTERFELLDATSLTMLSAASMLPPDDPRPPEWVAEIRQLSSTGYTDAEVASAAAALEAEADALTSAVVLPDPFTFTLTGRSGIIDLRLGNTSSEPLEVTVALSSTKVEFPRGDQTVTLRPNEETSVDVPVQARSNGTSSIDLVVSTPAGQQIGDTVTITSRVTGFTGLGYLLTGGLVLVLLSWWFTHVRARRRAALIGTGRDRHPAGRRLESDAL
jgi:hypothetical protein